MRFHDNADRQHPLNSRLRLVWIRYHVTVTVLSEWLELCEEIECAE